MKSITPADKALLARDSRSGRRLPQPDSRRRTGCRPSRACWRAATSWTLIALGAAGCQPDARDNARFTPI
ncbi:hypothetical protein ACRAWD_07970 [Caulobacter segnis]